MLSSITLHYLVKVQDVMQDRMIHGDTLTFEKDYGFILYNGSRGLYVKPHELYKVYIGTQEATFNE